MKKKQKERLADEAEAEAAQLWFGKNFCGCGNPEDTMIAFREIMDCFGERDGDTVFLDLEKMKQWEARHSAPLGNLLLYFLNATELAEHGGSVYGSWLTKTGKAVYGFLKKNPEFGSDHDNSYQD